MYNLNYRKKNSQSHLSSSGVQRSDVLAQVMHMCKESVGSEMFVRSVEAAPEPMCILASDQQLKDLERFCTGDRTSVLCIDPMFNLGPFYVTPTTYQNVLVRNKSGNHPILLGPVLVHQTKTLRPFHYLASTLVRLNPNLVNLRAYGTDGEPELIRAFSICFPNAVHLRCTNHLRQNIKDKLRSLNIPQSLWKEFLADIFGKQTGSHFEHGLVDCSSQGAFDTALESVKEKWNNMERSCQVAECDPQFHSWFKDYKARDIIQCVLPEVRKQAGLHNPLALFTTNCSEAVNNVIKMEVDWKESKLPVLVERLRSICDRQSAELERAVISRGEWSFLPEYKDLVKSEAQWFSRMTPEAKTRHLNKIFNIKPVAALSVGVERLPTQSSIETQSKTKSIPSVRGSGPGLSVSWDQCNIATISESTLENMWRKAEQLLNSTQKQILMVPWTSNPKSRLVKSSSSPQPHMVTTDPSVQMR